MEIDSKEPSTDLNMIKAAPISFFNNSDQAYGVLVSNLLWVDDTTCFQLNSEYADVFKRELEKTLEGPKYVGLLKELPDKETRKEILREEWAAAMKSTTDVDDLTDPWAIKRTEMFTMLPSDDAELLHALTISHIQKEPDALFSRLEFRFTPPSSIIPTLTYPLKPIMMPGKYSGQSSEPWVKRENFHISRDFWTHSVQLAFPNTIRKWVESTSGDLEPTVLGQWSVPQSIRDFQRLVVEEIGNDVVDRPKHGEQCSFWLHQPVGELSFEDMLEARLWIKYRELSKGDPSNWFSEVTVNESRTDEPIVLDDQTQIHIEYFTAP